MYIYEVRTYSSPMTTSVPVTRARQHFADLVDRAAYEPVFLTKRGRRAAVLISAEEYEHLLQAQEDAEDLAAADAAMADIVAGNPAIPWETVKADLGLA